MSGTIARRVLDGNVYMTLATADATGRPWASPVWFAYDGGRELYWVSRPDTRHSLNVGHRPEISIVIFDSKVAEGDAEAVYVEAHAAELPAEELGRALEVFSRRSMERGAGEWTARDVTAPAEHCLYRATATAMFVLGGGDRRVPVQLGA